MAKRISGGNSSERKIKKGKPITLLSILCFVMTFLIVMTFITFPVGIKDYVSVLGAIDLDYDIAGGSSYTLDYLEDDNVEDVKDINDVLDTLRHRMNALGYKEYSVKAIKNTDKNVKDYDVRIEAKTTDNLYSDIEAVAEYGDITVYGGTDAESTSEILTDGKAIESAKYTGSGLGYDKENNEEVTAYNVKIKFTDYAFNALKKLIADNDGSYYVSIKLGEEEVYRDNFSSKDFTQEVNVQYPDLQYARRLALKLDSGGLAYKYKVLEGVSVSSPYGENVGLKCTLFVLILLVLIMTALCVYYRGMGISMSLSLLAFMLLEVLMLIAVPGIVLSLNGVFGIVLATVITALCLAMTADRIKTDYAHTEKTVKAAVKKGFKDSLFPNINVWVVCVIVSLLMFIFTIGSVNCFAITFGIGSILGALTSLVFSRMFTSLILPICSFNERFLNLKREDK